MVDQDAGEVFAEVEVVAGLLGGAGDLLGGGLAGGVGLLQVGDALFEVLSKPLQFLFALDCQRRLLTRFDIHRFGEIGVELGFAVLEFGERLALVMLLAGSIQLRSEATDFGLHFAQRRGWILRGHESTGLEFGGVPAEGSVIPDRQVAGDLQAIHRFAVLRGEAVGRLVALDPQHVEQLLDPPVQA